MATVYDAAGNSSLALDRNITVDRLPPAFARDPEISGSASVGSRLTCSAGAIDGQSPSVAFQWLRANADGSGESPIEGQASSDYTLTAADAGAKVLCRVTATDRGGAASRTSPLTSGPFDGGGIVTGGGGGSTPPGGPSTTPPSGGGSSAGGSGATQSGPVTAGSTGTLPSGPTGLGSVQGPAVALAGCPVGTIVTLEGPSRLVAKRVSSGTSVAGAVRSGTGQPTPGVVVDLVQRVRRSGQAPATIASGTTGADGRFSLRAPLGPSRDLQVITRSCGASGPVVGQTVRGQLQVRAVNPRVRNGQRVRFSGRALGGYYGRGLGLELQVLVGRKWQDVRAVRTDRQGRFRTSYRFKRTYVRFTYRFRIITRATSGWPYTATRSPIARVRVN